MSEISVKVPQNWALPLLGSLCVAAFTVGASYALWNMSHPTRNEIAEMLAPIALEAKAANKEAFHCNQEIRQLRTDLARGFGRALTPRYPGRDEAGKAALRQYERELSTGVPADVAMRHVLEGDY